MAALQVEGASATTQLAADVYSYNCVLNACANGGQWALAADLLRRMRAGEFGRGGAPDACSYNTVLSALARAGRARQALALLKELEEPAPLAQPEGLTEEKDVHHNRRRRAPWPDAQSYAAALHALARAPTGARRRRGGGGNGDGGGDADEGGGGAAVEAVLQEILVEEDGTATGAPLEVDEELFEAEAAARAAGVSNEAAEENAESGMLSLDVGAEAAALLQRLRERRLRLGPHGLSAALIALGRGGRAPDALRLLRAEVRAGGGRAPNPVVNAAALRVCERHGLHREAAWVVGLMVGEYEEEEEEARRGRKAARPSASSPPGEAAAAAGPTGGGGGGSSSSSSSLYALCLGARCLEAAGDYAGAARLLARARARERPDQYSNAPKSSLQDGGAAGVDLAPAALSQWHRALRLLAGEEGEDGGKEDATLEESPRTYRAAITAAAWTGHWQEATALERRMRERGWAPERDPLVQGALVAALAAGGRPREALRTYEEAFGRGEGALAPDVVAANAALRACAALPGEEGARARAVLGAARSAGALVTKAMYRYALRALAGPGEAGCGPGGSHVFALLRAMRETATFQPDEGMFLEAIKACGAGGEWEACARLLRDMQVAYTMHTTRDENSRNASGTFRPGPAAYAAVLDVLEAHGRRAEADRLLGVAVRAGALPDTARAAAAAANHADDVPGWQAVDLRAASAVCSGGGGGGGGGSSGEGAVGALARRALMGLRQQAAAADGSPDRSGTEEGPAAAVAAAAAAAEQLGPMDWTGPGPWAAGGGLPAPEPGSLVFIVGSDSSGNGKAVTEAMRLAVIKELGQLAPGGALAPALGFWDRSKVVVPAAGLARWLREEQEMGRVAVPDPAAVAASKVEEGRKGVIPEGQEGVGNDGKVTEEEVGGEGRQQSTLLR